MSELNRVIEERLAAVEAGVAAAPKITVAVSAPASPKTGDLWIEPGGAVNIYTAGVWGVVDVTLS